MKLVRDTVRTLSFGVLIRRLLRSLDRVDARLAEQNTYLQRMADHVAPAFVEQPEARASVDFANATEIALTDAFIERTFHEQGRAPTDDEILQFLDDEATRDTLAHIRMEAQ